jgi:hypothetical protein
VSQRFPRCGCRADPVADSTPAVLATWQVFAEKYDLDLAQVLKCE